jgi:hypothetical protein
MAGQEQMVTFKKAKREVELVCRRLALLHISFARTLVNELGEEKGKQLVLKAIKDYGKRVGEKVRQDVISEGLEPLPENYGVGKSRNLPDFGMHDGRESRVEDGESRPRAYGCVMAKVWLECGEGELGRLYCYVDPAKYMAYNPKYKMLHLKAMPDGDEYCEFAIRPTTPEEQADFASEDKDWSYIDK